MCKPGRSLNSLCGGYLGRIAEPRVVQARVTQGSPHRGQLGRIAEAEVDINQGVSGFSVQRIP